MQACIIAVGSEMLTPFRVDTNSLFVTERLNAIGFDVRLKAVVGDDVEELAGAAAAALTWADLDRAAPAAWARPRTTSRATPWRACSSVPLDDDEDDRRAHPRALRPARHDDAGDQPAAGDGAARRDAAREPERHGARACGSSTGRRRSSCCRGRRAR